MIRQDIHFDTPHTRTIHSAVEALEKGGSSIYPTDTVYGIGCSIYRKSAIERLYKIKGKSKFDPMSLICNSIQQAAEYAQISNTVFRILKRCFPGPYTVVLPAKHGIAKLMLSRQKEIGIRIPDSPVCQMLVEGLGHPLLNTSVNVFFDEDWFDEGEDTEKFLDFAEIFLDAGPLPESRESTVVKIHDHEIEILREGKGDPEVLFY